MSEYVEFEGMRDRGIGPSEAYRHAKGTGMTEIESIRMLRTVYGQTLREAKETIIVASGVARNLEEHEATIARDIERLHGARK